MSYNKPFEKNVEEIKRFEEILKILFEEGFGVILDRIGLLHHLKKLDEEITAKNKTPNAERLRETFERLGPTFIKFGQILSERPDLIPEEYCEELEKLEDSAPPFDKEKAKQILDEEIGLDNFQDFEEDPVASASIAQVHKAVLDSGEEVAVKIRRPGIKEQMSKDLEILIYLGKKLDSYLDLGNHMVLKEVKEFSRWTRRELDLRKEGRNAERFRKNLSDEKRVKIPEIYEDYTTEKVLTMEYVEAVKCDDTEALQKMDIDQREIASTGLRSFLKQLIRDGFIHADPHPSNFMVSEDGKLVYLDFGMMADLGPTMERNIGLLILNTYREDLDGVMEALKDMSYVEGDAELEELEDEVEKMILELRDSQISETSISKIMMKISIVAAERGVYLPTKFLLIGKGLVTMEGIGLKIYPDFSFDESYQNLVKDLVIKNNANPKDIAESFFLDLIENQDLISKLPTKLNQKLEKGQERIEIKRERQDNMVPASVLLGSLYLISTSVTPTYRFIFGAFGVGIATYLILRDK